MTTHLRSTHIDQTYRIASLYIIILTNLNSFQCLGVLNYFKSIERTITIDLAGVTEKKKEGSAEGFDFTANRNEASYLHNTRIEHM